MVKFNSETARLAAIKSHAPTSARNVQPVEVDTEAQQADEFRRLRLARVRAQLTSIDKMLADEKDPGKLDRLASASIRLNEQERQLSNRSLPATIKAGNVKQAKRTGPSSPIVEIAPAQSQAETPEIEPPKPADDPPAA